MCGAIQDVENRNIVDHRVLQLGNKLADLTTGVRASSGISVTVVRYEVVDTSYVLDIYMITADGREEGCHSGAGGELSTLELFVCLDARAVVRKSLFGLL